ncbi:Nn.00g070470.m01.CDS01 [Neocucurbitaria sp. VM-36]
MAAIIHTAYGVVGNVGNQIQYTTSRVGNQLQVTTNRVFPPQQRDEFLKKLQVFANQNPKLAAFLATQAALTGLPLILFLAFATTTLLVSLTTCLLLGLLAALAFTFFVVGFALLFVVPTVFLASCSATFIFIWGFIGYVILRRLNEGEAPAKPGTRVGDKLHGLTGGRLGLWIGDEVADSDGTKISAAKGHAGPGERKNASGINGSHDWEEKWTNGVKKDQQEPRPSNPYEVLKVEDRIDDVGADV